MADDIDMNPDSTGNLTRPAPPTKSRPSGTSSSSSSGNTSSTTSSAATSTVNVDYDGPGKDYNDTDPNARFLGIGGHPEIWKDSATGQMFIVHFAEGTSRRPSRMEQGRQHCPLQW